MAYTTPPTFSAGSALTATQMNTYLRDNFKAIGDAWTSYSPSLFNWTLGNGTLTGYYMQVGKLVWGKVFYVVGSTDTKSGNLVISLPVTKVTDDGTNTSLQGTAVLLDTSLSARSIYFTVQNAVGSMKFVSAASAANADASTPFTWATGDTLNATFMYEAA